MATVTPTRVKRATFGAGTSKSVAFDEPTPLDSTYLLLAFVYLANSTTMTPPTGWVSIFGGSSGTNQIRLWAYQGDGVVNGLTWTSASAAGAVHLVAYPDFAGLTPLVAAVSTNVTPTTATYAMPDFGAVAGHGLLFDFIGSTGTHVGATLTQGTVLGGLDAGGSMLVAFEYQDGTGDQSSTVTMPSSRLGRFSQVVMPIGTGVTSYTADGGISLGGSAASNLEYTATGALTLGGSAPASPTYTRTAGLLDETWPPEWQAAWGGLPGGVTLGGSAVATPTYPRTAAGSISLGGDAPAIPSYPRTAAGSLTLGGSAVAVASVPRTAAGGLTITGTADATTPKTAAGGVTLGGSAAASVTIPSSAAGGVTLGGSATLGVVSYARTAAGSLTLGGSADTGAALVRTADGGPTLGGSATASIVVTRTAAGSLTLGGSTVATVTLARTATGGPTLGGSAIATATIPYTAAGGLALGGAATLGPLAIVATAFGILTLTGTALVAGSLEILDSHTFVIKPWNNGAGHDFELHKRRAYAEIVGRPLARGKAGRMIGPDVIERADGSAAVTYSLTAG